MGALNFGISARLHMATKNLTFVIEADEYDTAFLISVQVCENYYAKTAILNNLEYDHADIFPDLSSD